MGQVKTIIYTDMNTLFSRNLNSDRRSGSWVAVSGETPFLRMRLHDLQPLRKSKTVSVCMLSYAITRLAVMISCSTSSSATSSDVSPALSGPIVPHSE